MSKELFHFSIIQKIKIRIALWKIGVSRKDLYNLFDSTKILENSQPRSTFNLKDIRSCENI